ncbi:MAG: response regulator [Candidatus Levybacteria bacterium]|nr:response regulator [Candidatus Levybacteria bacterium]
MKKKILVADDDPAIVDCLQIMLEEADYEVKTTTDGETVRMVKKELPDVILLDIWMSGEDGRDICRYLKSQNQTKRIPIIMISATRDLAESAKKAGAEDFLTKPFQMNDLLTKVAKYIQ